MQTALTTESQYLFLLFTNLRNTCGQTEVVVLDHGRTHISLPTFS